MYLYFLHVGKSKGFGLRVFNLSQISYLLSRKYPLYISYIFDLCNRSLFRQLFKQLQPTQIPQIHTPYFSQSL